MNQVDKILNKRRAGVLLHITSLPGHHENGDFGQEAYNFINFLHDVGISLWQTLPLEMPDDLSPYQCISTHAGNPALISLEWLVEKGWLSELEPHIKTAAKQVYLDAAFLRFQQHADAQDADDFVNFCTEEAAWLDDFCLFLALKKEFDNLSWNKWPEHLKHRHEGSLQDARKTFNSTLEKIKFTQYIFFRQWHELKAYAHEKNVILFGDIPIFVAYDSADVWVHREVFKINGNGELEVVAGVPPDYFSETGQRWGNPHYNWDYLGRTGFQWWLDRIRTQLKLFDIIRIDHFRGLEAAWEIPADEDTAINGEWVKAPGEELLNAIKATFGSIPLVAEDLGVITAEVEELRDKFNLPGMKILHFAFDGGTDNPYLPCNYSKNCVVYTGTHDNDTTLGWFATLPEDQKRFINEYLDFPQDSMPYELIYTAFASVANLAILPMQDILELGTEHRMNIPGTVEGNWQWRFQWSQLTEQKTQHLAHVVGLFGRR